MPTTMTQKWATGFVFEKVLSQAELEKAAAEDRMRGLLCFLLVVSRSVATLSGNHINLIGRNEVPFQAGVWRPR